jgi:hypothetical protein
VITVTSGRGQLIAGVSTARSTACATDLGGR